MEAENVKRKQLVIYNMLLLTYCSFLSICKCKFLFPKSINFKRIYHHKFYVFFCSWKFEKLLMIFVYFFK